MHNQSMKFSAGLAVLGFTFISAICGQTQPGKEHTPSQNSNLLKIISDRVIWGENFLPAIAQAQAFDKAGEKYIEVFPQAILSGEKFARGDKNNSDAKMRMYEQAQADADKSDLYQKLLRSYAFAKVSGKTISYPSAETDSLVVGLEYKDGVLFKPDTKMEMVFKQFGKPERTDTRTINGRGEERPQILTLYSYERGIIIFAEADIAEAPGLLNRVFIDVPRFVKALNNEMK